MENHNGHILEMLIRKKGYSISEIARVTHVNRRTVYNWFNQKYLKTEIIYRIGMILKHDFSVEFPNLFTKEDFKETSTYKEPESNDPIFWELPTHHVWKDRYISLLEQYNKMLLTYSKMDQHFNTAGLEGIVKA
ncbi:helix-turn-helix domain-containing protein [Mucilaginibacter aquaedulcis]|jgi:lambda repressor-like predicted transcriptional regulator|uniref:helix-turn-helix domain-containing protein n=1 Tax=Mucilaginibacter aquaedulcis TaxID=1187081 RepID=UPI0025B4A348|nr:helix-turn-helix domain-containing protein [Mucilaginibacter aquaedulcis]MDN3547607.1 helix-turn-helix domain-containing protein [Mucilaginibacter aquaedulcis]